MKKFILALLISLLAMAGKSSAQIAGVTITGLSNADYFPGGTVAVTITIKNTNVFSQVNYDVLFSADTTASSAGYSSYLQGSMVCSGADDGFNFNSGIGTVNTVVRSVIVPSSGYSGHIVVIAAENSTFLTCSAATTYTTFTILNTPTPTNTATKTATSTVTQTPTLTPTATITNTLTNSPTATVTNTLTNTPTSTVTNTVTNTRTNTPSATPTITNTPYPTLSPVFLPVGGFNPSVTPQYFKTDSSGNLMTTSSGGSITVSGSTSITGGSLIAIPPTNTNTPTPTPTITGTITPTNTPTPIYQQDESVTFTTNLNAIESGFVGTSFNHVRKGCNVSIYMAGAINPFAATATPNINLCTFDAFGSHRSIGQANVSYYQGQIDTGVFTTCNGQNIAGSAGFLFSQKYGVNISSSVNLATITPTALPVTVIFQTAP